MFKRCSVVLALLVALVPLQAQAQVGVSAHVGSLGVGADLGFSFSRFVGVRLGANVQPLSIQTTISDVAVRGAPASPSFTGFLDLYPFGGTFRLSGGAVMFAGSHTLEGRPTGTVDFGGNTYDAALVGSVTASLETRSLAPYAGIGWGGATRSGFGFAVDLGVALHGRPSVGLAVDGPLAMDPTFLAALAREVAKVEDDVAMFSMYPVASIGLSLAAR